MFQNAAAIFSLCGQSVAKRGKCKCLFAADSATNKHLLQSFAEKNICDILHRFTESVFGGSADALSTIFDFLKRTFRNNIVTFQRI